MFSRTLILNKAVSRSVVRSTTRLFASGNQGFASMDPQKQRDIASKGGQSSHSGSNQHTNTTSNQHFSATNSHKQENQTNIGVKNTNAGNSSSVQGKGNIEPGSLVRYSAGANLTIGVVQNIITAVTVDDLGRTHNATPENPMAQIQNHYTKHIVYHHLSALDFVASADKLNPVYQENIGQAASPASTITDSTLSTKSADPTSVKRAQPHSKIEEVPKSALAGKTSEYAVGDVVRYSVANNSTAGAILEICFTAQRDENNGFHNASRENPMARIQNLFTQKVTYHHLSVLELVHRVDDSLSGGSGRSTKTVDK